MVDPTIIVIDKPLTFYAIYEDADGIIKSPAPQTSEGMINGQVIHLFPFISMILIFAMIYDYRRRLHAQRKEV